MPKSKIRDRICKWCNKNYQLNVDGGKHAYCSDKCRRDWHYNRWKSNGGKRCPIKLREYQLKTNYGISIQQFEDLFDSQDRSCKICKTKNISGKNWHVDHSHKHGKIRGILCSKCNQALGMVYDDIEILKNMIKYLEADNEK
jgi:hypothetical protein